MLVFTVSAENIQDPGLIGLPEPIPGPIEIDPGLPESGEIIIELPEINFDAPDFVITPIQAVIRNKTYSPDEPPTIIVHENPYEDNDDNSPVFDESVPAVRSDSSESVSPTAAEEEPIILKTARKAKSYLLRVIEFVSNIFKFQD